MPEPVKVFVSYARKDRAFAERLVNDLKGAGAEVWWDVSGIDEGDFLDKINEALRQCQWLVFVLTPFALESKWVKKEVNAAINRREKGLMRGILPILASPLAQDAVPPLWDNLHRYDAVADYDGEVARLVRTLGLPPRITFLERMEIYLKTEAGQRTIDYTYKLFDFQSQWDDFVAECGKHDTVLAIVLPNSRPLRIEDGTPPTLIIQRGDSGSFLFTAKRRAVLERAAAAILKTRIQVRVDAPFVMPDF
jgi:hypothetical protein